MVASCGKNLPRLGRPAKLKDHAKRAMVQDTLKNRIKPFQEIGHQAAENVSESTVRRALDEQGEGRSEGPIPYPGSETQEALVGAGICGH